MLRLESASQSRENRKMKRLAWMIGGLATCALAWAQAPAPTSAAPAKSQPRIPSPDWLCPVDDETLRAAKRAPSKQPKEPPKYDDVEQLTIPDSDQKFTLARINDTFNAPDWFPAAHGPMPDIVAKGHKPKIIACAYCHTPTGQGR